MKPLHNNTPERQVAFLHSARTRKHQAFNEVFTKLNDQLPTFNYAVLYSEEGDGFINREFLTKSCDRKVATSMSADRQPFMQAVIGDIACNGRS